jgi:hypothetical protein
MDKDKKKEAPPAVDGFVLVFGFLIILAVAPFFLTGISGALAPYAGLIDSAQANVKTFFDYLIVVSFPVSVALMILIVYTTERLKRIRKLEAEKFDKPIEQAVLSGVGEGDPALAHRWSTVSKHMESDNPNDWKQAIMEADIMLDDLLTNMGYRGESIGEKLKRVDSAQFQTLQDAWDAHLVRNRIAHDGSAYPLNEIEARRVIQQYRKVFEEFYFI